MTTVLDAIEYLNGINTEATAAASLAESATDYAEANRQQLAKGENEQGKRVGRYRSMKYARMKESFFPEAGKAPDNVNLRFTGAFWRGLRLKVSGTEFNVKSDDSKSDMLESKYSQNGSVFGLNEDHKDTFITGPLFARWSAAITKLTGLQFKTGT